MSWTNALTSFTIFAIVVIVIGTAQAYAMQLDPEEFVQPGAYGLVGLTVVSSAFATFRHYKPKNIIDALSGNCGFSLFMMALLIGMAATTLLTSAGYHEPDIAGFLIGR